MTTKAKRKALIKAKNAEYQIRDLDSKKQFMKGLNLGRHELYNILSLQRTKEYRAKNILKKTSIFD